MPVDANIRAMMDVLDEHAPDIGSGAYTVLANHLKNLSNDIDDKEKAARRSLAREMIVERPECINALAVYPYTHDPEFMQSVMRTKACYLQAFTDECAAVLGSEWKQQLTAAVLEKQSADMYLRLRLGIMSLLMARADFLPNIVHRLAALKITPAMLFAKDLGLRLRGKDKGEGPTAIDLLHNEPRLLRWLLGCNPTSAWPAHKNPVARRLIQVANASGGDDPSINGPCECPRCRGLVIPTAPLPHATIPTRRHATRAHPYPRRE